MASTADAAMESLRQGLAKLRAAHAHAAGELRKTDESLARSMAAVAEYQSSQQHVAAQYEAMQVNGGCVRSRVAGLAWATVWVARDSLCVRL